MRKLSKKIYLHFDLNRTVLMSDAAGGRSIEDTVNYLLAEVCYGKAQGEGWAPFSPYEPRPGANLNPDLVSYKSFGDRKFPYLNQGDASAKVPEGYESIAKYNKSQKKHRKKLQSSFTNEGSPGVSFRPYMDDVLKALSLPEDKQEAAAKASAEVENGLLAEFCRNGKYFLLPSFLNFLVYLQSDEALMENVNIIYRTFGEDLEEVSKELKMFQEGKHPCYPGLHLDRRLCLSEPFGVFFRNSEESDGIALAIGTMTKAPKDCADIKAFYEELGQGNVSLAHGFAACHKAMMGRFSDTVHAAGFRDYFEWWHSHGESDDSGKVLLVNDKSSEAYQSEYHAFIDDHVEADHSHIVDVRTAGDGSVISPKESIGKVIFRAEPYVAITNDAYFIEQFEMILKTAGAEDVGDRESNL